jgi:hypothetical protein
MERERNLSMTQRAWLLVALTCAALTACDHEDPCDKDVSAGPGACKAGGGSDAAMDANTDASSDTDAGGETTATLGADCQTDPDCGSDAPFCAKSPFDMVGYCTLRDCDVNNDACPDGYMCLDLGFGGVPPFCSRQ